MTRLALLCLAVALAAAPRWAPQHVALDDSASWWVGPPQEPAPVVRVDRGEAWAWCEAALCVVVAQGPWTTVEADGETVWRRGRVWLPGVRR